MKTPTPIATYPQNPKGKGKLISPCKTKSQNEVTLLEVAKTKEGWYYCSSQNGSKKR